MSLGIAMDFGLQVAPRLDVDLDIGDAGHARSGHAHEEAEAFEPSTAMGVRAVPLLATAWRESLHARAYRQRLSTGVKTLAEIWYTRGLMASDDVFCLILHRGCACSRGSGAGCTPL
jgi:hypothetical protein